MWWFIAIWVVSAIAVYFLMPKPEVLDNPSVEEVDIPVAEDGKAIPVLFGTRDTESFNVVWWGDVATVEFKVSGGDSTWYQDIEDVHGGYYYFVGIHAVLFHGPIDHISRVMSDDKLAWEGENTGGAICDLGSKDLYGGKESGGGFGSRSAGGGVGVDWPTDGCLEILMGEPTQERNWYLEHNLDDGDAEGDTTTHEIPAFRGVVSAVLNRVYIGTRPNLRKLLFRGQRIHVRQDGIEQWYDEKADIPCSGVVSTEPYNGDVAVAMLYDLSHSIWRVSQTHVLNAQNAIGTLMAGRMQTHQSTNDSVNMSAYACIFGGDIEDVQYINASNPTLSAYGAWISGKSQAPIPTQTSYIAALRNVENFFSLVSPDARKIIVFCGDGYGGSYSGGFKDLSPESQALAAESLLSMKTLSSVLPYSIQLTDPLGSLDSLHLMDTPPPQYTTNQDGASAAVGAIWHAAIEEDRIHDPGDLTARDLNPAHIIRECITDPDWGMGLSELRPDENAFRYAADLLYSEGMGISIKWLVQTTIDDFIDLIKKHINAELYTDHATGKYILKLIRDDYDPANIPVLGESDIVKVENASRPMIGELVNSVTVQYWDMDTGKDASVTVHDQALIQVQGVEINSVIKYPGFTCRALAIRVAERDLKALSSQPLSCTLYVKRTAESLNLGSVFTLVWPDLELGDGIIMRVKNIDFGRGRENTIKIDVIEDVFRLPAVVTPYGDSDPSWTNPTTPPVPVVHQISGEMPYTALALTMGQPNLDSALSADSDVGWVYAAAARPENALNAAMLTEGVDVDTLEFCGSLTIDANVDQIEKNWVFSSGIDLGIVSVGMWGRIDDELIEVQAIDTSLGTMVAGRAVLDTSPRDHAIDARVYFWNGYRGYDKTQRTATDIVSVKVLPRTSLGVLDESDAAPLPITLNSRAIRPYPPGNLLIDGVAYPVADASNVFTISWAHRDRTENPTLLIEHTDGSVGPEAGTTYTVQVREGEDIKIEHVDISGTSQSVDISTLYDGAYDLRVFSERNSIRSWQECLWGFNITGAGDAPDLNIIVNGYFDIDLSSWTNGNTWWVWHSSGRAYHAASSDLNILEQLVTSFKGAATYVVDMEVIGGTILVGYMDSGTGYTYDELSTGVHINHTNEVIVGTRGIQFHRKSGVTTECYLDNVRIYRKLLTNGDFSNSFTGWINPSSYWTIVSGRAYHAATSTSYSLDQYISEITGSVTITFDLEVVQGGCQFGYLNSAETWVFPTAYEVGTYTGEVIVAPAGVYAVGWYRKAAVVAEMYLDNVSIAAT